MSFTNVGVSSPPNLSQNVGARNTMITQEQVKELFDYHPAGFLTWKKLPNKKALFIAIGQKAGTNLNDYIRIKINNKLYFSHKLIFLFHNGNCDSYVDHIDGNSLNNKIENLRACTPSENSCNKKIRSDNTNGFKGIRKKGKKFAADIVKNGKRFYLGVYKTPEEAHLAYKTAAIKIHGEFARF